MLEDILTKKIHFLFLIMFDYTTYHVSVAKGQNRAFFWKALAFKLDSMHFFLKCRFSKNERGFQIHFWLNFFEIKFLKFHYHKD